VPAPAVGPVVGGRPPSVRSAARGGRRGCGPAAAAVRRAPGRRGRPRPRRRV